MINLHPPSVSLQIDYFRAYYLLYITTRYLLEADEREKISFEPFVSSCCKSHVQLVHVKRVALHACKHLPSPDELLHTPATARRRTSLLMCTCNNIMATIIVAMT